MSKLSDTGAVRPSSTVVVDLDDSRAHDNCGLSAASANMHLGVKQSGLDYDVAAVRELFEETGILLAEISGLPGDLESIRAGHRLVTCWPPEDGAR